MIDTIYIEKSVAAHPRSHQIIKNFPSAKIVEIDHYGEIFNRNNQSFRIQKSKPGLILATKEQKSIAGSKRLEIDEPSYYFSHMLNCLYDCRYCFLQGMFKSANYIIFVNYEDFHEKLFKKQKKMEAERFSFQVTTAIVWLWSLSLTSQKLSTCI